jgi:hypothetical protein
MNSFIPSLLAASLLVVASAGDGFGASPSGSGLDGGDPGPVYIDSAEIQYLESWPVQVRLHVEGSLPTPCHELAYEVRDLGSSLDVRMWSFADADAICAQVLEPFDVSIDLGAYESANLPVVLNGDQVGTIELGEGAEGLALAGAGWSFGLCLGYCVADLVVDGDELIVTGRGRAGEAPLYENRGSLTDEGRARLDDALSALADASLAPVYGCPDCADGGAAWLDVVRDGEIQRVEMGYGEPPDVLAGLHGIAMSLIDAIEACERSPLVEIPGDCTAFER